jgi:hypothetical protein
MKDLKRGDFVWSKIYGNGLIYTTEGLAYGILFEDHEYFIHSTRADLFAKGDEVEATEWIRIGKAPKGVFIGTSDIGDDNNLIIETNNNIYKFVTDIKHKSIDKLEVILTLNGKEIDVKAISKETWENLRRIE